jgi:hypothetical protein
MGGSKGVRAPTRSRIVRMSPMVSPKKNHGSWMPPAGMTLDQFMQLRDMLTCGCKAKS